MIKLKMTAANSSSQPQYWDGWRRTRTKWPNEVRELNAQRAKKVQYGLPVNSGQGGQFVNCLHTEQL
jgi:hypothetical protein